MLSLLVSGWVDNLQPQGEAKCWCLSSITFLSKLDSSARQTPHIVWLGGCHRVFFKQFLQAVLFQNALFDNLTEHEKKGRKKSLPKGLADCFFCVCVSAPPQTLQKDSRKPYTTRRKTKTIATYPFTCISYSMAPFIRWGKLGKMSWQNHSWVIAFSLPEVTLYFHRVGVFILVSPSKFLVTLEKVFIIHKSPLRKKVWLFCCHGGVMRLTTFIQKACKVPKTQQNLVPLGVLSSKARISTQIHWLHAPMKATEKQSFLYKARGLQHQE